MGKGTFEITSANFEAEVLGSALPVLVDFTADWCPPCKMIAPVLAQLAQRYEGQIRIGAVDVDAHPEIMNRYFVQGLPTLVLFQNGEEIKRFVGYQPITVLEQKLAGVVKSPHP